MRPRTSSLTRLPGTPEGVPGCLEVHEPHLETSLWRDDPKSPLKAEDAGAS